MLQRLSDPEVAGRDSPAGFVQTPHRRRIIAVAEDIMLKVVAAH